MLLFLAVGVLGCTGEEEPGPDSDSVVDSGDSGDSGGEPQPVCPDPGDVPTDTEWAFTANAPAGGLSVMATNGSERLYLGSTLAGMWALDPPGSASWRYLSSGLTTHTVGDVAVHPTDPWSVYRSAGGRVVFSEDGGDTWFYSAFGDRAAESGFPGHAYGLGISLAEPVTLYGLLDTGVFGVSHNGGLNWEARGLVALQSEPDTTVNYYRHFRILPGRTESDAIVVHDGTNLWRSVDDGWNWTAILADTGEPKTLVRNPANPDELHLGNLVSVDAGATWAESGDEPDLATWGVSLLEVFGSTLRITRESGTLEVQLPTAAATAVAEVDGVLVLSAETQVWRSTDDGANWTEDVGATVEHNFSVVVSHPTCPGVAWAGTRCDSGVYRTEDWGRSWQRLNTHGHYVMDVVFSPFDPEELWLINDDMLMRSTDGGSDWELVWQAYHFHGFAFDPQTPGRLLVGSVGSGNFSDDQGQIYLSEDDGKTWTATEGIPANDSSAHTFAFLGGDVVLAGFYKAGDESHLFGEGIGLYRSVDDGRSWTLSSLPEIDVAHVMQSGGSAFAATGGGVYRSDDAGETWTQLTEGYALWVDVQDEVGFALYEKHGLDISTDGGATWSVDRAADTVGSPIENPLARVDIDPTGQIAWWSYYSAGIWQRAIQ